MNEDDKRAMTAFGAGFLAGVMAKDERFKNINPLADIETDLVTGEVVFELQSWHYKVSVQALRPIGGH